MKKITLIGINGFGRIGRNAARIILGRKDLRLAAINSRSDSSSHAYLLKYDSTYGILKDGVVSGEGYLEVSGQRIEVFNSDRPEDIPWDRAGVDVVIDATGKFRKKDDMAGHLKSGVKFAVVSAPAKDDMKTLVIGVNHDTFDPSVDKIVSNSSCTTNCLSVTLKILKEKFGIKRAFMTTVHAVTDSQNLLDNSHKKEIRLRRSSLQSMIPASTGSANDIGKLFPELKGKIVCQALRVPTATVSLILLTAETDMKASPQEINDAYEKASKGDLKGILSVSDDELVSKDYTGNSSSSVVDTYLTRVSGGNLVSLSAWYDNEWGYTSRLVDLASFISKS